MASMPAPPDARGEACPLCGDTRGQEFTAPNGVVMRRCAGCGLFVNVTPGWATVAPDFYAAEYHETRYGGCTARKQRTAECLVRQIEALCPGRGRLLDIGCSYGYLVAAAQQWGWEAYGVDVSADMVAQGQARGLALVTGNLRHLPFPDGHFAVVHARHVLEHERDFFASLAEMHRVLVAEGLLFLAVPDGGARKVRRRGARYTAFWVPEHLVCFTRATLDVALQRAGFEAVRTPLFAGCAGAGARGLAPFLAWRLAELAQDALGLGKTLRGVWRKRPS